MSKRKDGRPTSNTDSGSTMEQMQKAIADKLEPLLENVIHERAEYWKRNPSASSMSDVPGIVSRASKRCAVIAFGCNLVPGPLGLLAIVPEITLIIQEQLQMLYDIGRAYGKPTTKELLLGLLLSGTATGSGGLITIVGGKVIVKRASLRVLQKLIAALGGKITQAALKSLLAKWVPLAGATAMALWGRYSTIKLGKLAEDVYSKPIVLDAEYVVEEPEADAARLLVERVRLLVALTWIDRRVDDRERAFVAEVLKDPDLPPAARDELELSLKSGKVGKVDYGVFVGHEDDQIAAIMDLIALAKIDNEVHPAERALIREVGKKFGRPQGEVEDMMTAEFLETGEPN